MVSKKILFTIWATVGAGLTLFALWGAHAHGETPISVDVVLVAVVVVAWSGAFWVAVFAITSRRPNSSLYGGFSSVVCMALPFLAMWRLAFSDTNCGLLIAILSLLWGAVVTLLAVVLKRPGKSSNMIVAAD